MSRIAKSFIFLKPLLISRQYQWCLLQAFLKYNYSLIHLYLNASTNILVKDWIKFQMLRIFIPNIVQIYQCMRMDFVRQGFLSNKIKNEKYLSNPSHHLTCISRVHLICIDDFGNFVKETKQSIHSPKLFSILHAITFIYYLYFIT